MCGCFGVSDIKNLDNSSIYSKGLNVTWNSFRKVILFTYRILLSNYYKLNKHIFEYSELHVFKTIPSQKYTLKMFFQQSKIQYRSINSFSFGSK